MTRAVAVARNRVIDFLELTKPRLVLMVLLTTTAGFYLGSAGDIEPLTVFHTLVGTMLAAAGTLALNQFQERDLDSRMERTRHRPLADGRIDKTLALSVGGLATVVGTFYLAVTVNTLAGLLTATIAVVYLFIYTPLKRRTALCSVVGAVPGALPPLVGMAAARGALGVDSLVLFSILFLWQIPHSLAVARLFRDDYARAGIKLAPMFDPEGRKTGAQAVAGCVALFAAALFPTFIGLAGAVYLAAALTLGLGFIGCAAALAVRQTTADARRLLMASLLYLPLLLTFMVFDKGPV